MRTISGGDASNHTPGVEASDKIAVRTPALSRSSSALARDQPTCCWKCGMLRFFSHSSQAFWYSGA